MNTAPERAEGDRSTTPPLSRLALDAKIWAAQERGRNKDDYLPSMPPVENGGYLLDLLFEIGPTMAAGMGSGPIGHQELAAWCHLTCTSLRPWEARMLRRLSVEYLSESHAATERGRPSPWQPAG